MNPIYYPLIAGLCAQFFWLGFMVGDIAAMKREDKHREELRRIRLGLE